MKELYRATVYSLNHFFSQVSETASKQTPKSDTTSLNRPKNSSLNGSTLL